ncbi:MAG: hypothetical protein HRT54_05830 [Colwellia sp.]|nr:hypothetical protein [Colwellia sp.]
MDEAVKIFLKNPEHVLYPLFSNEAVGHEDPTRKFIGTVHVIVNNIALAKLDCVSIIKAHSQLEIGKIEIFYTRTDLEMVKSVFKSLIDACKNNFQIKQVLFLRDDSFEEFSDLLLECML